MTPSSVGSQATNSLEPIVGRMSCGSTDTSKRRASEPGDRLAQLGRAVRGRVARHVRGRAGERVAHHGGDGVHRGADREVDDPAGVSRGERLVGGEGVPGEVGEVQSPHSSWFMGGRSLIHCGSAATLPTLDAPPGEPSSSKKSTFALV